MDVAFMLGWIVGGLMLAPVFYFTGAYVMWIVYGQSGKDFWPWILKGR